MAPPKVENFKADKAWTFDSIHLAHGIAAVSAFVDSDRPVYQFDLHADGVVIVGTDTYSLLVVFVPHASGNGYEATRARALDGYVPSGPPETSICALDREKTLAEWARFYGKASRLKEIPVEHVAVQSGPKASGGPPVLGEGLEMRSVRFAGDVKQTVLDDTCAPINWRRVMGNIDGAKPVDRPIRLNGASHSAIGDLGKLDPDRIIVCQTVVTDSGFEAITIDVPGSFPQVSGYCAAARR